MATATESKTSTDVTKASTIAPADHYAALVKRAPKTSTVTEFVTASRDDRNRAKFDLTTAGEELHKEYMRAFQIAEERGPKDRDVVEIMERLTTRWPSHPGVVENAINEQIEAKETEAAVKTVQDAVDAWTSLLKGAGVKTLADVSSGGSAGLLYIQLLANYVFALERGEKLDEAFAAAQMVRTIEPSDPENVLSSVISLSIRLGEPMTAIRELEPLADSPAPFVLYGRALAYYAAGQFDNAQGAVRTAIRNWPLVAQGITREWTSGTPMPRPGEAISELQVLYGYYEVFGSAWQSVVGSVDWLRAEEAAFQRSGGRTAQHARLSTSGLKSDGAGNIVPVQAQPETQQELLRKAVVIGQDEYVRFLEVTPNHYVYDLTELGKEMEERHQAIYREDMTFNERTAAIQELVKEWPGHLSAAIAIGRQFASRDKFSEAVDVLQDAIFDAQKFWPENFLGKGFIEAEWASNKNLLTAYAHVTVDCESAGELESAQAFASDYLMFNPKDGLGVRQKAIDIEMQMGNVEKALSLIEEAVDPRSAYNVFGRALVYYKLGKKKDADEALRAAVESRPLIYREMTNDRHRMPAKYNPAFVYYFSREEAFNYYMLWSKLWRTSHGAIAWLRKEGRRIRQEVNARPATAKS